MTWFRTLLLSALLLCASAPAFAESGTCEDGFFSSDATSGHCCWPGQVWSDERERCTGAPQCPTGWEAKGSTCARVGVSTTETHAPTTEQVAAPPKVSAEPPAPKPVVENKEEALQIAAPKQEEAPAKVAPEEPSKPAAPPNFPGLRWDDDGYWALDYNGQAIPPGYRLDWRARRWLTTPGFILGGVTHGLFFVVQGLAGCSKGDQYGWIPIAGSTVAALACGGSESHGSLMQMGLVSSGVQLVGLAMVILAYVEPQRILVPDVGSAPRVSWTLTPGTASSAQGLTLGGRF